MVKHILLIISSIALFSCNNHFQFKGFIMPTGDAVDRRFNESMEMHQDLKLETVPAQDEYSFYVATDPHVNKTHENLSIFNDAMRNDMSASFGVVLGDCIDVKDNLPKYLEALAYDSEKHSSDQRIFHITGNHDLYFDGWDDFKNQIGPSVYWFDVIFSGGKDLFISLDTATGTLGNLQTMWLRSFLSENRQDYRHCIILTHVNIFYTDNSQVTSGNLPIEETYSLIDFFGRQNVTLVLQGHDHHRDDLTYANVRYTVLGTIKDGTDIPEYLIVHVDKEGARLEWRFI